MEKFVGVVQSLLHPLERMLLPWWSYYAAWHIVGAPKSIHCILTGWVICFLLVSVVFSWSLYVGSAIIHKAQFLGRTVCVEPFTGRSCRCTSQVGLSVHKHPGSTAGLSWAVWAAPGVWVRGSPWVGLLPVPVSAFPAGLTGPSGSGCCVAPSPACHLPLVTNQLHNFFVPHLPHL